MTGAPELLPDRLPEIEGVELAATHLPGSEASCDWYDVMLLPGEAIGIAIADVPGRGAPAAALAARLRHGLRARALDGDGPGQVLEHVNSLVTDVGSEMSTVIFVVFTPATGELRGANAGHPPAMIRRTGGAIERWDAARSLPLGAAEDGRFAEDTVRLDGGEALLLFTDGLIEQRGAPIEDGLERLAQSLPLFGSADALRTGVLEAMLQDGEHDDDVAVVALAVPAAR